MRRGLVWVGKREATGGGGRNFRLTSHILNKPRFRKVALVNQGYKERVAKVQGHEVRGSCVFMADFMI